MLNLWIVYAFYDSDLSKSLDFANFRLQYILSKFFI